MRRAANIKRSASRSRGAAGNPRPQARAAAAAPRRARCGRRRFTRDCLRPSVRQVGASERARAHARRYFRAFFFADRPRPPRPPPSRRYRGRVWSADGGGGQEAGVTCTPSLRRVRRVITGFVYVASAKWVTSFHDGDNAARRAATSNAHKRRFVPPEFRASASVPERACGAPRSGVSGLCRIGLYNGDRTPAFNEHCACRRHNYRPRNPVL